MTGRDFERPDPNVVFGNAPVAEVGVWMQPLMADGTPSGAARFKGFYPINQKIIFAYTPEGDADVRLFAIPRAANGTVASSALEDAATVVVDFNREISTGTPPVITLAGAPTTTAAVVAVANTTQYATARRVRVSVNPDMSGAIEQIFNAAAGTLATQFNLAKGGYPATVYVSVAHSSGGAYGGESNVLAVTWATTTNPATLSVPLTVTATTLPAQVGAVINDTPAIYSIDNLTLRNASNVVVPAGFVVRSRWHGEVADTTKPIKRVGVYFTPNGGGAYTLDNSGANTAPASPITLVNNANDYTISTGNLAVTLPKSGINPLTSFKLSTVEQLTTTKPSVAMLFAAKSRLAANASGVIGNVAAQAGQNFVTVRNPEALRPLIGQSIKFQWIGKYVGFGNDFTGDYLRIEAEQPIAVLVDEYTPDQRLVFARGTGNAHILTSYSQLYQPGGILYRTAGDGFNTGTMPIDSTVEDQDALDQAALTITSIEGNRINLSGNLSKRLLIGTEIVAVTPPAALTASFKIQSATIYPQQSPLHLIVKQDGWFEIGANRVHPYLQGTIWWHFYAGQSFARVRLFLKNQSSDVALENVVFDAACDQLKFSIPLANAVTASSDEITAHSGAGSASARVLAGTGDSTAVAGSFKHCAVEFAQNFPAKLVASGSLIEQWIMPVLATGFQHHIPGQRAKVLEITMGLNADTAAAIVRDTFVTISRSYSSELAIYPSLPTAKHTWVSAEVGSNARQLEAVNIVERLFEVGYDYTKNDASGSIAPAEQFDLDRWKLSNHLFTAAGYNDHGPSFGLWIWGQSNDYRGGDGFTNGRYAVGDAMLKHWWRTGELKAWRLAMVHATHAATMGLEWGASSNGGNRANVLEGGAVYEKSVDGIRGTVSSTPTHHWPQVGEAYLATGDPIMLEALLKERARALWLDRIGVTGYFAFNDFRAMGRLGKKFLESYLVFGIASDLEKCAVRYRELRALESGNDSHGWACTPERFATGSDGVQLFNWFGYCADGLTDYLIVKRSLGTPDFDLESFLYRQAKFATFGDSQLVARGTNAPLRFNQGSGAAFEPAGGCYYWHPNSTTAGKTFEPLTGIINLHGLTLAAFWFKNAALRLMAEQLFEALAFYRDQPTAPLNYTFRQWISYYNRQFSGSSTKVYFQMIQACMLYLWWLSKNAALTPPVLNTIAPTSGAASSAQTLTLAGTGFVSGAEVSIGGVVGLIPSANSGTSITVALPAASLPAGAHPVMVTNPNGGQSQLVTLTLT